jgi:hypothetical protein
MAYPRRMVASTRIGGITFGSTSANIT